MEQEYMSPCFRYLIRHASKDGEELLRFAKLFFSLLLTRGASDDEAALQYSLLSSCLAGITPYREITEYRGNVLSPYEFREAVMSDDTIGSAPDCCTYCKEILGDNSVCRICPYTNCCPYVNDNIDNEYKLLRFIHESADNLKYFREHRKSRTVVFKSEVDLAKDLSYDYPVIVPINRECAYGIVSKKSKASKQHYLLNLPLDERLKNLESGTRMPLVKANPLVDDLCVINHAVISNAWAEVSEKIASAELIDRTQFRDVMGPFFRDSKEKPSESVSILDRIEKTVADYNVRVSAEPNISETPFLTEAMDELRESDGCEDKDTVPPDSDIPHEDGVITFEEMAGVEETDYPEIEIDDSDIPESAITSPASDKPDTVVEESESSEEVCNNDASEDPAVVSEEGTCEASTGATEKSEKRELPGKPSVSFDVSEFDPFNKPIVLTYDELKRIASPLTSVPIKDALSSKAACEVVFCDGEYALLFYFFKSNVPGYVSFKDMPDVAKDLLSRRGFCLVTYQPYFLYSLCRIYGYRVRNIYSIFSADRLCFESESRTVRARTEMLKLYAGDKAIEWSPECSAKDELCFMPLYRYIKAMQGYLIKSVDSRHLDTLVSYDELMGSSLLTGTDTYNRLFCINKDTGLFEFERGACDKCPEAYSLVSYEVSEEKPDIFLFECLLGLIPDMKMQACGFYIYSISGNKVSLLVPNETYELTVDLIDERYCSFAHRNPTKDVTVTQRDE